MSKRFYVLATTAFAAALPIDTVAAQPIVTIDGVANQRERTELQSLIDATTTVLNSNEFETNLRSLATIVNTIFLDGPRRQPSYTTIAELVTMMEGGGRFRFVPVAIALSGDQGFFGGLTGWIGFTESDNSQVGSMTLYRGDLARWRSQNVVERSCAVNTVAHEITHTISTEAVRFIPAVTDYNRFDATSGTPAASYLIGTVAQCTWLQLQTRIPANGFSQCAAVFGARHFNNRRCDQFAPNQTVEVRVGLPAEATDIELDKRP